MNPLKEITFLNEPLWRWIVAVFALGLILAFWRGVIRLFD